LGFSSESAVKKTKDDGISAMLARMQTETLSAEAASSDASLGTRYRRVRSGT
jgi:hypothetical protein